MRAQIPATGVWRYTAHKGVKVHKVFKGGRFRTLLEIFESGSLIITGNAVADIWVLNAGGSGNNTSDGGRISEQYNVPLSGRYRLTVGKSRGTSPATLTNVVPPAYGNLSRFGEIGASFQLAPGSGGNANQTSPTQASIPRVPFDLFEHIGRIAGGGGRQTLFDTATPPAVTSPATNGYDGGGNGNNFNATKYGAGGGGTIGRPYQGVIYVLFNTLIPRASP